MLLSQGVGGGTAFLMWPGGAVGKLGEGGGGLHTSPCQSKIQRTAAQLRSTASSPYRVSQQTATNVERLGSSTKPNKCVVPDVISAFVSLVVQRELAMQLDGNLNSECLPHTQP